MSSSDEEFTYHDSLLSFNDGKDFFEEVLGGMQNEENEQSDSSEEDSSSSINNDECGCGISDSDDNESPFIDDNNLEIEETEEESSFIDNGKNKEGGEVKKSSVDRGDDDVSEFIVVENDNDDVSDFIVSENNNIEEIQNIIGGLLRNF